MSKLKVIVLFFLTAIFFISCNCKVADYPRNVKFIKLSENSSYYILTWDSDPDASKYIIHIDNGYEDKTLKTDKNYYLDTFYSSYSYGVSMTVDGEESYVSDYVTISDSICPFTSLIITSKNKTDDGFICNLEWNSFPDADEYILIEKSYNSFSSTISYYSDYTASKSTSVSNYQIDSSNYYALYAVCENDDSTDTYLITNPISGEELIDAN